MSIQYIAVCRRKKKLRKGKDGIFIAHSQSVFVWQIKT